jgi:hypothetical protein
MTFNESQHPRAPAGSPKGGEWTSAHKIGSTVSQPIMSKGDYSLGVGTRKWHGMDVDREFVDDKGHAPILEKLNSVPGITIVSTNAGHPPGGKGIGAGAQEELNVGFVMNSRGVQAEQEAEKLATKLRSKDTKVDTSYWRGPNGNWVTHVDGKPRLDTFSKDEIEQYSTDRASVRVSSTFVWKDSTSEMRQDWWNQTIRKLNP